MEFQRMVLEAETKRAKLQSAARQAAIQGMIQKSWRDDQEAVSAAFSKWIRITMLYDDEREVISFQSAKTGFDVAMAELDAGRDELDNSRLLLQERGKRLEEKERDVEVLKKDAEKQAEALRLAKDKLDCDISRLLEEKKSFLGNQAIKMTELEKERERLEKDRATLAQLDKFLLMKGKKLDSREKAIEVSQGSLSVDSSKQLSIALEKTIDEERKLVDKAAKVVAERELDLQKLQTALGETENRLHVRESQLRIEACEYHEAHDRIKRLAEQLREKEGLLNKKEAELSNSMSECRTAQTRVHVLAQQLKQKDEDLANERRALAARCKECDECEVQLSVWQRELDDTAETLRLQERTK
jgi:chromosome segregation ATPase